MLLSLCHSAESGWVEVEDLGRVSNLRAQAGNLLWAEADVGNLTGDDVTTIAEEFDLHPLAVEDATKPRQRPKLDVYDEHLFLVMHQLDLEDGQLEPMQLSCFVGPSYVLTIHHGGARTVEKAKERWRRASDEELAPGPMRLVHTLIDVIVDDYQLLADALEEKVEDLEDLALARMNTPIQRDLYSVKQQISRLRRFALPSGRVLDSLRAPALGREPTREEAALFEDIRDHISRMSEQIRAIDDLSQAVLDLVQQEQAQVLNETSRRLAAWAAIFAVATVIAGIYGMNFQLVPDENSLTGFFFALGLIVASCGGLYLYLRRQHWL